MPCIFENFQIFSIVSHHFSNIFKRLASFFEYFQSFSNVFERFYFAHLAQSLQLNPLNFIFTSKTNITLQILTKKSPFFPNSGYFKSSF